MVFLKEFVIWTSICSAIFGAGITAVDKVFERIKAPVIREDISCLENARLNKLTLLMHSRRKLSLLCMRLKLSGYSEEAASRAAEARWVVLKEEAQQRYEEVLELCDSARGDYL
ncbi:MAG: hypothetical protein F6K62_19310 [Sphaerospermopsis sp. SIO1G2]|nr:hypothetical protein [Sphaerospermopsis sp. SIO1G2]